MARRRTLSRAACIYARMLNTPTRDYSGHWTPIRRTHDAYALSEPPDEDDDHAAEVDLEDETRDGREPS